MGPDPAVLARIAALTSTPAGRRAYLEASLARAQEDYRVVLERLADL